MSSVTNIILTAFLLDGDERTKQVLELDLGDGQGFVHINDDMPSYGNWSARPEYPGHGPKPENVRWHRCLEHDIFIAAVNYLEWEAFREQLLKIDFGRDRDGVRVMICGQEQSAFKMWNLDDVLNNRVKWYSDDESY